PRSRRQPPELDSCFGREKADALRAAVALELQRLLSSERREHAEAVRKLQRENGELRARIDALGRDLRFEAKEREDADEELAGEIGKAGRSYLGLRGRVGVLEEARVEWVRCEGLAGAEASSVADCVVEGAVAGVGLVDSEVVEEGEGVSAVVDRSRTREPARESTFPEDGPRQERESAARLKDGIKTCGDGEGGNAKREERGSRTVPESVDSLDEG
ncbi:hypothetical protein LTS18_012491, partial [Coniosporium uncinatum]